MGEILVDKEDRDLLENHNWWQECHSKKSKNKLYYCSRVLTKNGVRKKLILHRVIMERIIGRPLETTEIIDHIDFNGLNNRRKNLLITTKAENARRRRMNENNTSGFRGVVQTRNKKGWQAQICYKTKVMSIGRYLNKEHASIAYDAVARILFNKAYTPFVKHCIDP